MPEQEKQPARKTTLDVAGENKINFFWILLGIGAVLVMWLVSSWLF